MRSIRYVLAALAVLASAAPAGAQSDPKAAVAALDTVVRKYSNYKSVLDPFVEKVYSKFRKSAEVATGIARSEGIRLFFDIGTNGELVAGCRDFLLAGAGAAHPVGDQLPVLDAGHPDHVPLQSGRSGAR